MTILFSDIRDFTALSEGLTPKENFDFINGYLAHVGPVVREHHGFIDKYIGDAVMALFPSSPDDALRAAIGLTKSRDRFNVEWGGSPVQIGVGLHTGTLMLGIIGEHERLEGTVISDAVNAASRIEGLTKTFGASILISEDTYLQLSDPSAFKIRHLGLAEVKGKAKGLTLYEVCDGDPAGTADAKMATKEIFEEAVAKFFAGDQLGAAALFEAVREKNPGDQAAAWYLERCKAVI